MTHWTTLLRCVGIGRPRPAAVPQRATRLLSFEEDAVHVAGEYQALWAYLEHRYASVVVLTFDQIEALLGFPLPGVARTECEWWIGTENTHGHAAAWIGAGRTAAPNLLARTVTFQRAT
jgi:hypothetical protein